VADTIPVVVVTAQPLFTPPEITVTEAGDDFPYMWDLQHDLSYDPPPGEEHVHIECGFRTDFASVPRFFTWLFPRYGRYAKAAVVHDWLCRNTDDKFESDRVLRLAMKHLDVAPFTRSLMWGAVSLETIALVCFLRRLWLTLSLCVATAVVSWLLFATTADWVGALGLVLLFFASLTIVCFIGSDHRPLAPIVFGTWGMLVIGLPIVAVSIPIVVFLLFIHGLALLWYAIWSRRRGAQAPSAASRVRDFLQALKSRRDDLTPELLDACQTAMSPRAQRLNVMARSQDVRVDLTFRPPDPPVA